MLVSTLLLSGCQNNKNKTPEKKDEYTKNLKFELLEDDTYGVRIGRAYFEKSISIQPYFEDKPVTKILEEFGYIGEYDPNTFDEDCEDNKYAICEKILLPNTITTLDYDAFYYCKNLLAVYIPKSVTEFNDFWKCNSENCHYYFEADEVSDDIIDAERYEGYVEFGVTAEEFKNIDLDTLKPKTVETEIMINGVLAEVTFTKNEDGKVQMADFLSKIDQIVKQQNKLKNLQKKGNCTRTFYSGL